MEESIGIIPDLSHKLYKQEENGVEYERKNNQYKIKHHGWNWRTSF
jgi:hypothetical protein